MEENMEIQKDSIYILILKIVVCLLIAALSFFGAGRWAESPSSQAGVIRSLDEKKENVLELTGASTATSVAITMLPGDAATPIAEQLADLSKYFLLILCAIYFEKYLVTITGFATFKVLIPVAMAIMIYAVIKKRGYPKVLALKIIAFGLALFLVIPASVGITDMIEKTYQTSIDATLESAEAAQAPDGEASGDASESTEAATGEGSGTETTEESGGILDFITGLPDSIKEGAENVIANATSISEEKIEELKGVLNHFIEAIAVMIITSCVIPILVLIFFISIIRLVFGRVTGTELPYLPGRPVRGRRPHAE